MPINLDQVQKVVDAATSAPWEQSLSARGAVIAPAGPLEIGSDTWRYYGGRVVGESMRAEDSAFAIVARNAMPELVAELRVTRKVAEAADRVMNGIGVQSELRAALTAWHEHRGETR